MVAITIGSREPKICSSCKIDLFKEPRYPNGYICGKCGQQFSIKDQVKEDSKKEENK